MAEWFHRPSKTNTAPKKSTASFDASNDQTTLATPTIQSTTRSGSEFTIRVTRSTGLTYSLYRSTLLTYGTWTKAARSTLPTL